MPATESVRRRTRRIGLIVCMAAVAMVGCAAPATTGTAVPDPTGAGSGALPEADAQLPAGVAGATGWTTLSSLPNEFDISARFPSPEALADAYVAELEAGWAGGPLRPTFGADTFSAGDVTVMVVTELGPDDDSVAGAQYALVIGRHADGWTLDGLWARSLCHRGVDRPSQLCV